MWVSACWLHSAHTSEGRGGSLAVILGVGRGPPRQVPPIKEGRGREDTSTKIYAEGGASLRRDALDLSL